MDAGKAIQRLETLFLNHGIVEVSSARLLSAKAEESKEEFDILVRVVKERKNGRYQSRITAEFLLLFLLEVITYAIPATFSLQELLRLLKYLAPTEQAITGLFDLLRCSIRDPARFGLLEDLAFHKDLLHEFEKLLRNDNPSYMCLSGEKDSSILVSSVAWSKNGYTLMMWIRIPDFHTCRKFDVFRCKNQVLEINASMVSQSDEGIYFLHVSSMSEKKGKEEATGKVFLPSNGWHLLTIKHTPSTNMISAYIDGSLEFENRLAYPSVSVTSDAIWTIGTGFHGFISSITAFAGDLSTSYIHFLHGLGVYVTDLNQNSLVPQSSYDTGQTALGTLYCRGSLGKLQRLDKLFMVNALMLSSSQQGSQVVSKSGKAFPDFVAMSSPSANDRDILCLISLTGNKNSVIIGNSWLESLMECGGVSLLLYLLWLYSTASISATAHKECILHCLEALSIMFQASCEAKEQFIQLHGFHLIAYFLLQQLSVLQSSSDHNNPGDSIQSSSLIDISLIEAVRKLVGSLGMDAVKGDGIAAAFQGILFDFRLWTQCPLQLTKDHLEGVASLALRAGDHLYQSIGFQKLLDITRFNLLKSLTNESDNKQLCIDCADEIFRLLIIMKDSAAMNNKNANRGNFSENITSLIACLEETNHNLLAERIVRLLSNIRFTNPGALQHALIDSRYHDTVIVSLWTKNNFSLEIRTQALANLMWLLGYELQLIPPKLLELRKNMLFSSQMQNRRRGSQLPQDQQQSRKLLAQLLEEAKPLNRTWKNLMMLAEVMKRALEDDLWGHFPVLLAGAGEDQLQGGGEELFNAINAILHEYQNFCWLLLPFLPHIIPRITYDNSIKLLMLFNLQFKTEDTFAEALICMEGEEQMTSWMNHFLMISTVGNTVCTTVTQGGEMVTIVKLETLTDIAIEILSIIVEYDLKSLVHDPKALWTILQTSISHISTSSGFSSAQEGKSYELVILRRCCSLVLQRLVKVHDEDFWSLQLLKGVDVILDIISKHSLHLSSLNKSESARNEQLIDIPEESVSQELNNAIEWEITQAEQLLYFVMDLMSVVRSRVARKQPTTNSSNNQLWATLNKCFALVFSALPTTSDVIIERMSSEMLGYIHRISEIGAPFTEQEFTKLILEVLNVLRLTILDLPATNSKRLRLEECMFTIVGHFTDLRCKQESLSDINSILAVLEVMCQDNDPISFFEEEMETSSVMEQALDWPRVRIESDDIFGLHIPTPPPESSVANNPTTVMGDAMLDLLDFGGMEDSVHVNKAKEGDLGEGYADLPSSPDYVDVVEGISAVQNNNQNSSRTDSSVPISSSYTKEQSEIGSSAANSKFQNWLKIRQGIILDHIDTERSRLTRSLTAVDMQSEATKKFWRRLRRKIESEVFMESHVCHWKLAVSHEGPLLSGRKRLVLRPRFEHLYGIDNNNKCNEDDGELDFSKKNDNEMDLSSDELNEALQRQFSGYIQDVTRTQNPAHENLKDEQDSEHSNLPIPGTGWGLVGADGSDEGYGIVGLAHESSSVASSYSHQDEGNLLVQCDGGGNNVNSKAINAGGSINTSGAKSIVSEVILPTSEDLYTFKSTIETGPCPSSLQRTTASDDNVTQKLESKVILITASGSCWGILTCTSDEIFFRSSHEQIEERKQDNASVNTSKFPKIRRRKWRNENICAIYLRRYRLRDSAMEIFFRKGKHRNFFVDFGHTREDAKIRNEVIKFLTQHSPSIAFKQSPTMSPSRMVYEHGIQDKWLQGKMSNFDYLMALNTLAGRSFNDLCQYPVMPWVLSDYSSSTIDLNDPRIYRDLSKPMGALNETRLKEFLDRYNSFEENVGTNSIPPFMYGSHYSTMVGVVLHFLVRLQPFAALHKEMQNGHFDVSDRLFSSIPRSYAHNTNQLSEVKELIPEFFTTPDMFRNVNNFNLGYTQDNENVDDVELPPWAKTPEEFIRVHREALESDYVSEHLHDWIDLIFGYKQRGPDAVDAHNVFYYLTYYGAVDHYCITDEAIRKATELQIAHFGQTPMQLFRSPHPQKKLKKIRNQPTYTRPLIESFATFALNNVNSDRENVVSKLIEPKNEEEALVTQSPSTLLLRNLSNNVVIHTIILIDRVLFILDNGVLEMNKYSTSEEAKALLLMLANEGKNPTSNSSGGKRGSSVNSNSSNSNNNNVENLLIAPEDLLFPTTPSIVITKPPPIDNLNHDDGMMTSSTSSLVSVLWQDCRLRDGESLLCIEKEYMHFEVVPRLPLSKKLLLPSYQQQQKKDSDILSQFFTNNNQASSSSLSIPQALVSCLTMSKNNRLALCHGQIDGSISVREVDLRYGAIRSGGDFIAHKRRVVSLSIDNNALDYHIIASCDETGVILVWTIHTPKNSAMAGDKLTEETPQTSGKNNTTSSSNSNKADREGEGPKNIASQQQQQTQSQRIQEMLHARKFSYTIPRRPQRLFRIPRRPDMHVEISWPMNVVVAVSGNKVHVFSIERNEMLRFFYLDYAGDSLTNNSKSSNKVNLNNEKVEDLLLSLDEIDDESVKQSAVSREFSSSGPTDDLFANRYHFSQFQTPSSSTISGSVTYITRHMVLSDYGMIIFHIEASSSSSQLELDSSSLLEFEDSQPSQQHLLLAYTINGVLTANISTLSPVTCLTCPDRSNSEIVICGCRDGSVCFYRVQNLQLLYRLQPSVDCVIAQVNPPPSSSSFNASNKQQSSSKQRSSTTKPSTGKNNNSKAINEDSSAIISISLGPNRLAPAMIVMTTEAGNVYFKALPDFLRWERHRKPSALQQLASVPLQAVKGTLIQAQNWTAETVGVLKQNAKSLTDDAMTELNKMRNNSVVKGVFSFFGGSGGGGNDSSNNKRK